MHGFSKVTVEDYDPDADPSSRQRLVEGWRQEDLAEAKILVAGAGAIGNELVKNFLLLGIGTIQVVDFDYVINANLNRCIFFRREDAREKAYKAKALARRAKEADPYGYIRVVPIVKSITEVPYEDEIFRSSDVYVSAVDNVYSRLYLNVASIMNGKPLIDTGMLDFDGYVHIVDPGRTACLHCILTEHQIETMYERMSCSGSILEETIPKVPSIPTTTSIVAAVAAQETAKIILNSHDATNHKYQTLAGKIFHYGGRTGFAGTFTVERNPACIICGNA